MNHEITIEERVGDIITVYRAACSCGEFLSAWFFHANTASGVAFQHVSKYWD